MRGLRASIWASQEPGAAPFSRACLMTALAPITRSRRSVRSPILVICPSFCLPPVDFCSGVSPSQAEKSRPRRKVCGAGLGDASRAAAVVIGPTPGMVISRRAIGSSLTRLAISRSSTAIWSASSRRALDQDLQAGPRRRRQLALRVFDLSDEALDVADPLGRHLAVLGDVPPDGVDDLGPLTNQKIASAEHHA